MLLLALAGGLLVSVLALLFITRARSRSAPAAKVLVKQDQQRPSFDANKPLIRVLYGTQTGTAERFSKQLANELRAKFGDSTVIDVRDIETYKAATSLAKEKLVVFCMATYGDGEPTDNAADFYSWLCKEADAVEAGTEAALLQDVTFAVFGLGNKQYEHFNSVGKRVFSSLTTLGAKALCKRGDGDDDGVIDDDFEKWCADFHTALDDRSDLVGTRMDQAASAGVSISVPAYKVVQAAPTSLASLPFPNGNGTDVHSPFWATVRVVRELHTPASDRSCVHVEIDISGSSIMYQTGDHIAVYAQNSPAVVEEVAQLLNYDLQSLVEVQLPENPHPDLQAPMPGPLTLHCIMSFFADVLSSPHKEVLAALSTFASDRGEAERLQHLASPAGKAEYQEFIVKSQRSLLEVLRAFPSAKPSIGAFLGCIVPRLQPRYYSISSSATQHPSSIHVTCALVQDVMPTGRMHHGVCSSWLKERALDVRVPVFVRHSHFRLPAQPTTPVLMVGPGTGLAPFRAFLQERAALASAGAALGPAHLFFGCRSRHQDYIYKEELEAHLKEGVLTDLHLAFSRQGAVKDYVQHHLVKRGEEVWELMERGAHVYVCGDAKHMARDVHKALIQVVQTHKPCTGTAAEAYVKQLTDTGRYQRDVW